MGRWSLANRWLWLLLCLLGGISALLLLASPGQGASLPPPSEPPAVAAAGIRHLTSGSEQIQFTLHVPAYELDALGALHAPGLNSITTDPGAPALPYYSTLVALPPEADARVTVRAGDVTEQALARAPRPAPSPDQSEPLPREIGELPVRLEGVYQPDPAVYQGDAPFPTARYRLSEPRYYRDVRYVQLDLFPLQYRPDRQAVSHARDLHVSITFEGASSAPRRPAATTGDAHLRVLAGQVLNPDQMSAWRSLPASLDAPATRLPVGREVYKIEVDAGGIYAVSGSALQAQGMAMGTVALADVEMLYRGEPVAYDFHDQDGDGWLDAADTIYFYGWAFDGPRTERQFITNNVFWLWAGDGGQQVAEAANPTGGPVVPSFRESITREEETVYMHTWTDDWDQFPNEPDSWYWELLTKPASQPVVTVTHAITLPDPALTGDPARLTVEYLSAHYPSTQLHEVSVHLNDAAGHAGTHAWLGIRNVNVEATVPVTALLSGRNQATTVITTANSTVTRYYLNRVTVDYQRLFRAVDDQLIFADTFADAAASHTYQIGGFSENDPADLLVWDITDRLQPQRVPLSAAAISGSGPYTYTFGTGRETNAAFIATTRDRVKTPLAISSYLPADLEPAGGGADWLAIGHDSLLGAVTPLADHRRRLRYGGLDTHLVDVQDVINQYGYGLPLPAAIHDYLAHALVAWQPAPAYVLLVGDATVNPRDLECARDISYGDCDYWSEENDPNLVLTDIIFTDRIQGTVISDHTFVLLAGDDVVPDMAIGRLAGQTAAEVQNAVAKIILYEESYWAPQSWQDNILFLADNADQGGDFCGANARVSSLFPEQINQVHLCLEADPITATLTVTDVETLRGEMFDWLIGEGVSILNYRGHGSVAFWGGSPLHFTSTSDLGNWLNYGRAPVILSLDCLDGFFAYPGLPALSETLLAFNGAGSAAHWSSAGLGYTYEHSVLQEHFYRGLYEQDLDVLGDAIIYTKMKYDGLLADDSELYAFTLHGDPAMRLRVHRTYLSTIIAGR